MTRMVTLAPGARVGMTQATALPATPQLPAVLVTVGGPNGRERCRS